MSKLTLRQFRHYALLLLLLAVLTLLMVYPLIQQIAAAFLDKGRPSLYWLSSVLSDATFRSQLLTSLALGLTVTLLCNLIAFPLALISARYDFTGKTLLAALVLTPMVLPPFVGAIGMKQLLGSFGSLTIALQHLHLLAPDQGINWLARGGFWALATLISFGLYPIAYLNLQAALANIAPACSVANLTQFCAIGQPLEGNLFDKSGRATIQIDPKGLLPRRP
ncbi:MAG: hypothetical protein FWD61_19325 [Phycisphaerales bacterium]|nr:hypothetical protein [Phycisphaerales bacterium]